jgi:hypothetical protein
MDAVDGICPRKCWDLARDRVPGEIIERGDTISDVDAVGINSLLPAAGNN